MADDNKSVAGSLLSKFTRGRMGKSKSGALGDLMHMAHIPGFKHGGKVKKTGVYKLHAGETVVPANETPEQFRKRKLGHKN
jgi:hypothetical protein